MIGAGRASGGGPRPILVVEDDEVTRRVITAILEGAGHVVLGVSDGEAALDAAPKLRPGAVLVDLRLPGTDGTTLVRQLRATMPVVPIIVVTSVDDRVERVAALDAGADDYVTKPFDPAELLARVRAKQRDQLAWSDQLERMLRERSSVLAAMTAVEPRADLSLTAGDLCRAALELDSISGAAILRFTGDGSSELLGCEGGFTPDSLRSFTSRSGALSLRARASGGGWYEHLGWGDAAVACATISDLGRPTGVLMLRARDRAGRDVRDDLATAIDLAAVASVVLGRAVVTSEPEPDRVIDLREPGLKVVFQPVVDLLSGSIVGWEALSRFADGTPPDVRFAQAHAAGVGDDLEVLAIRLALAAATGLPPGFTALNLSPSVVVRRTSDLALLLVHHDRPVVVELTEHQRVDDYAELRRALGELEPAAVSVDDAGTGFASLRHVMLLRPEHVKLDRSWIAGIDADPAKQAMVAGLAHFARLTETVLVAEGVETPAECQAVTDLGVDLAQGHLFGVPGPAADWPRHAAAPQVPGAPA